MHTALFEVFRVGKHTNAMQGGNINWTHDDLNSLANLYSEKIRSAPAVIGHPADDLPAYGTAKKFIALNGRLMAEVEINDFLFSKIQNNEISGISLAIFLAENTNNPLHGVAQYVKHVGFLERQKDQPAVKGMIDPKVSIEYFTYSEIDGGTLLFCDETQTLAEQIHNKALYLSNSLETDYKTALNLII